MLFRSPEEFLRQERKAITLLGMSNVGKTTLASKLPGDKWYHYSGDYRIGTKYLSEHIVDNLKIEAMRNAFLAEHLRDDSIFIGLNITFHNLNSVSRFLGKLGDPERHGLSLASFKDRQRQHRRAEINAMLDVPEFRRKARDIYSYDHFLNDAGGSLCEIIDIEDRRDPVLEVIAENTLILYLEPDAATEARLVQAAQETPKPLFYDEVFLDRSVDQFLRDQGLTSVAAIDPDRFIRWIFPRLLEHRKPRYRAIADRHGYTISATAAAAASGEDELMTLIGQAIEDGNRHDLRSLAS